MSGKCLRQNRFFFGFQESRLARDAENVWTPPHPKHRVPKSAEKSLRSRDVLILLIFFSREPERLEIDHRISLGFSASAIYFTRHLENWQF